MAKWNKECCTSYHQAKCL